MLEKSSLGGEEVFVETDKALSAKFADAGFGIEENGVLYIPTIEACYLVKIGKASFGSQSLGAYLKKAAAKDKSFGFAFSVFSTVRGSGRVLRRAGGSTKYFRVWSPGVGRHEIRPSQLLCLLPGKKISEELVKKEVALAHLERLDLIFATGTPEEPKFYKVSAFNF